MRVYLIDDRQLDYQEPTMPASAEYFSDEEFIEIAKSEGTVYSLEDFQKEWNTNALIEELDQHWIRII